jgi:hypothetical protein
MLAQLAESGGGGHWPVPHRAACSWWRQPSAAPGPADAGLLARCMREARPASRWCSARSTSAATRCCLICASIPEDNPALGWRGDPDVASIAPALLRTADCARCCVPPRAAELRVMLPMVSEPGEIIAARAILAREIELNQRRGTAGPSRVHFGIMIEVPSLLFDLEAVVAARRFRVCRQATTCSSIFSRAIARTRKSPDASTCCRRRSCVRCRRSPRRVGNLACQSRCAARSAADRSRRWR